MEPIMEVSGLNCDSVNCNFHDNTVLSADYEKYVDTPCPLCGSNLLTRKDYDKFRVTEKFYNSWIMRLINKLLLKLGVKPKTYELKVNKKRPSLSPLQQHRD